MIMSPERRELIDLGLLRRATLAGIGVWVVATLLLRLAGHHIILQDRPITTMAVFAATMLVTLASGHYLNRWLLADALDADTAAIGFAAPGLLLDAGTVMAFAEVYPVCIPRSSGNMAR
jgi:uncharacterized membrane protein YjjB (DUF3815 family)